jgi:hypothetical protein
VLSNVDLAMPEAEEASLDAKVVGSFPFPFPFPFL